MASFLCKVFSPTSGVKHTNDQPVWWAIQQDRNHGDYVVLESFDETHWYVNSTHDTYKQALEFVLRWMVDFTTI